MSAVELSPEHVHAIAPVAQGVAGDSASPEAIRKLSRQLAGPKQAAKTQRKVLEKLKAALAAVRNQRPGLARAGHLPREIGRPGPGAAGL